MRRASRHSAFISLLFLVFSVSSVTLFVPGTASAQQCEIIICKSAEGAGDTPFPFVADIGVEMDEFALTDGGLCVLEFFTGANELEVTEGFVPGWVLEDVICETDGIESSPIRNGVVLDCVAGDFGTGTCTFVNVPGGSATNIPTLSEWGMIAAAAGLGLVGVWFAIRKKRAVRA